MLYAITNISKHINRDNDINSFVEGKITAIFRHAKDSLRFLDIMYEKQKDLKFVERFEKVELDKMIDIKKDIIFKRTYGTVPYTFFKFKEVGKPKTKYEMIR